MFMPICDICDGKVDIKKRHVYYYETKRDGTRSKIRTYQHYECAGFEDEP
jgi:hypothetical protein